MNLTCIYCSWNGLIFFFEKDHITPLSRGGSDTPNNLRWICFGCNRQKGDKNHSEYILWRVMNPLLANFGVRIGGVRNG
jgi:5-methylcytosine-specific restriction endonuclease McrA